MAIIDPDGLFGGDRIRKCSNAARLHWPYFFLASNGFGRFEVNYSKIVDRAFSGFNPVPSQRDIEKLILEYKSSYLLFLYKAPDGSLWGQWDTKSTLLKKHKTAKDHRSPAPDPEAFANWQAEYRATKNRPISPEFLQILGIFGENDDFSAKKPDFEPIQENFPLGGGVGVGDGIGVGKGEEQSAPGNSKPLTEEISDIPPDDANELQCALWFAEMLGQVFDSATNRIVADSFRLRARELKLPVNHVAIETLARAKLDQDNGATINRFWFSDGRFKKRLQGNGNGTNQRAVNKVEARRQRAGEVFSTLESRLYGDQELGGSDLPAEAMGRSGRRNDAPDMDRPPVIIPPGRA